MFTKPDLGDKTAEPGEPGCSEDADTGNGGKGSVWSIEYGWTDESLELPAWPGGWFSSVGEVLTKSSVAWSLACGGAAAYISALVLRKYPIGN